MLQNYDMKNGPTFALASLSSQSPFMSLFSIAFLFQCAISFAT